MKTLVDYLTTGSSSGGGGTTDVSSLAKTGQLPATVGQKPSANSVSVVFSTDGPFTTNFGTTTDAVATSDTGTWSLIALTKRLLQNFTTLLNYLGVERVIASDGVLVPIGSLDQVLTYAGPGGALDTVTVTYSANTYKQTLSYTGTKATTISKWVKQ